MSDDSWHPRHRYIETCGTAPVGREESLPIAETRESFAIEVVRLTSYAAMAWDISRRARGFLEDHFTRERFSKKLITEYLGIIPVRVRRTPKKREGSTCT